MTVFLPVGSLRESKSSYQRADIVIVTKCPEKIDKTKSKSLKDQLNIKPHQTLYLYYNLV